MRRTPKADSQKVSPRALLKRLLQKLRRNPLDQLPERSVEALSQFLSGYAMFGGPVWQDLVQFELWLTRRFYFPPDVGKWDRFIELNSADGYDSYERFFELYSQFIREVPDSTQRQANPIHELDPKQFDFYQWLYWISCRPGKYFGSNRSATALDAYLSGYFAGKRDSRLSLSRDEKEFLRFENWLWRTYDFKRRYPWYRLVELWPRNVNSAASFFDEFDAFLTDFGKRPRGLEDLFEVVTTEKGKVIRRRRKLPKKPVQLPKTKRHWRGG